MNVRRITIVAFALVAAFGAISTQVVGARAQVLCEIMQRVGDPPPACRGGVGSNIGGGSPPVAGSGFLTAPQSQPIPITGFNMPSAGSTSVGVVLPGGNVAGQGMSTCMIVQTFPPSFEPRCLGGAGINPVVLACPAGTAASNGACFAPLTFTAGTSASSNGAIQVTVAPPVSASAASSASVSASASVLASSDPTVHLSFVLGSQFGPWRDYLAAQLGYGPDQLKAMTDYFGSLPACWAAASASDCTAAIMADVALYFPAG